MVGYSCTEWGRGQRLAIVVAALLVGCSGGEHRTEDRRVEPEVPCEQAIEGWIPPIDPDDLTSGMIVHGSSGGFIALPDPERPMQLGRSAPEGSGYEGYRFAKFGLVVRGDRLVSVEVVEADHDAVLKFGSSSSFAPSHALRVGPCPATLGEWVVFAGGLWVSAPGCVELVASHDDEVARVRLPVGAACEVNRHLG